MTKAPKKGHFPFAILIAGLILAAAFASKAGFLPGSADDFSSRFFGALLGAILVFFSNDAPKKLTPLALAKGDPARRQAIQRFTGWAFVLSGLGFSICWLFAPIGLAAPISITLVASAFILVLIKCYLPSSTPQNNTPSQKETDHVE